MPFSEKMSRHENTHEFRHFHPLSQNSNFSWMAAAISKWSTDSWSGNHTAGHGIKQFPEIWFVVFVKIVPSMVCRMQIVSSGVIGSSLLHSGITFMVYFKGIMYVLVQFYCSGGVCGFVPPSNQLRWIQRDDWSQWRQSGCHILLLLCPFDIVCSCDIVIMINPLLFFLFWNVTANE